MATGMEASNSTASEGGMGIQLGLLALLKADSQQSECETGI